MNQEVQKNTEKPESYYQQRAEAPYDSQCEEDLLDGKIKIYEVPILYRDTSAYCYACRAVRVLNKEESEVEKKLIENQLLADIMECRKNKWDREKVLRKFYYDYFILGCINWKGLI